MTPVAALWSRFLYKPVREAHIHFAALLLRASFGLFMLGGHGWAKLMGFSEQAAGFADPLGIGSVLSMSLAVFAEVFCSLGLIVGFLTRLAVIPPIVTMLVAVLVMHLSAPFARMEKGLLYLIPYLVIFMLGPGKYSVDAWLAGKLQPQE